MTRLFQPGLRIFLLLASMSAAVLLHGCVGNSGPGFDDQVLQSYRVGMSHDETKAVLQPLKPRAAGVRPGSGWVATKADDNGDRVIRAAIAFEKSHPGTEVQSCELYWVPRQTSTSIPDPVGGLWFDWLLFDKNDKLVGYYRHFAD